MREFVNQYQGTPVSMPDVHILGDGNHDAPDEYKAAHRIFVRRHLERSNCRNGGRVYLSLSQRTDGWDGLEAVCHACHTRVRIRAIDLRAEAETYRQQARAAAAVGRAQPIDTGAIHRSFRQANQAFDAAGKKLAQAGEQIRRCAHGVRVEHARVGEVEKTNVHIERIEVNTDDPDRFAHAIAEEIRHEAAKPPPPPMFKAVEPADWRERAKKAEVDPKQVEADLARWRQQAADDGLREGTQAFNDRVGQLIHRELQGYRDTSRELGIRSDTQANRIAGLEATVRQLDKKTPDAELVRLRRLAFEALEGRDNAKEAAEGLRRTVKELAFENERLRKQWADIGQEAPLQPEDIEAGDSGVDSLPDYTFKRGPTIYCN
jgi:hypothetical protein